MDGQRGELAGTAYNESSRGEFLQRLPPRLAFFVRGRRAEFFATPPRQWAPTMLGKLRGQVLIVKIHAAIVR